MLAQGIIAFLKAESTAAGDQVFTAMVPAGQPLPALVVGADVEPDYDMIEQIGLAHSDAQIACWAERQADAESLAEEVRLAISGYSGTMGTYTVQACFITNMSNTPNIVPDAKGRQSFGVIIDCDIEFVISKPS